MDSLTQALLGASVAEYIGGKKYGNKAPLIGAALGTVPDLDVFIGPLIYGDTIQAELFHRSVTHSFLFAFVAAPLFGRAISKLVDQKRYSSKTRRHRTCLAFFCLLTHILLDLFTGYGTQILWPFIDSRYATDTIFIIDPLYTVPFLTLFLLALRYHKQHPKRRTFNARALLVSTGYLLRAFSIQAYTQSLFTNALEAEHRQATLIQSSPERFTTFLWRGFAEDDENWYLGWWSVFDTDRHVTRKTIPKNYELLRTYSDSTSVQSLLKRWNYLVAVEETPQGIDLAAVQFGLPLGRTDTTDFLFTYQVSKQLGKVIISQPSPDLPERAFQKLRTRISGR